QRQRVRCSASPTSPCYVRASRRSPGAQPLRERANLLGGLREFRAETSGLPDLKLVAEAGEGDLVLDASVSLERFGENRPALAVDLQHFARAVKRRRKLLALLRIGRKARDQRLDLPEQRIAAGVEGGPVERRLAVEARGAGARAGAALGRPRGWTPGLWIGGAGCSGTQSGP